MCEDVARGGEGGVRAEKAGRRQGAPEREERQRDLHSGLNTVYVGEEKHVAEAGRGCLRGEVGQLHERFGSEITNLNKGMKESGVQREGAPSSRSRSSRCSVGLD